MAMCHNGYMLTPEAVCRGATTGDRDASVPA